MADDRPGPAGYSATLLVRVWSEAGAPDVPRARLLTVDGPDTATWATVVGEAGITRGVLDWLRSASGRTGGPRPARRLPASAGPGPSAARPVAPLVDADWLQQHLEDPGVVVVEVAADDAADDAGTDDGDGPPPEGVPGAGVLRWQELHHPVRRAGPGPAGFAALMDSLGVAQDAHVVLCDEGTGTLAAAALWCFASCGHRRTSLLDGGLAGWRSQGRPTARARQRTEGAGGGYVAGPAREDLVVTRDQLLLGFVGAPAGTAVLDCRSPAEFAGHPGPGRRRRADGGRVLGHVPGAVNLPVGELLVPGTSRLLPVPALEALLARRGVAATDHVVVHCGIGDRSPLVWFVLHELLGWPDVRCYTGGWAEYGSLGDVPVEVA